jgi:hypothetical protein
MKRGDCDWRVSDSGILFMKWRDNRSVHMLSTAHGTDVKKAIRRVKDGSSIEVDRPMVVEHYNRNMGGVDHADMLRSLYGFDRKSKKWWHRLFFGLLDMTMVNSFIVYCELVEKISVLEFTRSVVSGLLAHKSPDSNQVRKRRRVAPDAATTNRGSHWPLFSDSRGRCSVCAKEKRESRPFSYCSFCKAFLCCNSKYNCFASYHGVPTDD